MSDNPLHRIVIGGFALAAVVAPMAMLLLADHVASTTESMIVLPAYNKYRCALCHTTGSPTEGEADLSVFGVDFRDNGKIWNRTLALLNSDNDKCLNGFELGDQDGDGVYDYAGEVMEHSNPSDSADCSIALNVSTWGVLKEIFRSELQQYLGDEELDFDSWSLHFP
ncbi:MAG: hypothetical protein JSW58_13190 [Candidatus Latescibacterota bacterium]|nr:MAG: hypothetical protein JSW58_13190 [Candidatus Latescibacterota bacterium]